MAVQNVNNLSYTLSLNILKALGGDTSASYESVDDIWGAINDIYDATGDRVDIEALVMTYTDNGSFQYYPTETVDAYAPVLIDVAVPQKYTDEQVAELQHQSYIDGETAGYSDGFAKGMDTGAEDQKKLLDTLSVTENGTYTRADGWNEVTVAVEGYTQEELNQLLEQSYAEGTEAGKTAQKQLMTTLEVNDNGSWSREDGYNYVVVNVDKGISNEEFNEQMQISYDAGYDSGYDKGIADGYTQGETAGYNDGYAEGLDDGAEDQKALLESTTLTKNGTYTKEDGWNEVIVAVEGSGAANLIDLYLDYTDNTYEEFEAGVTEGYEDIDGFSRVIVNIDVPQEGYSQEDLDNAASDGYQNGYDDGHGEGWSAGYVQAEEDRDAAMETIEIKENGTYTSGAGFSEVVVAVEGSGGGGKPKIYNGFRLLENNNVGLGTTNLSKYDFSQYDWSNVYDLSYFFGGFQSNDGKWWSEAFTNFKENFNGKFTCGKYMFQTATGYYSYAPLGAVPDFGKQMTKDLVDMSYMFYEQRNLSDVSNLANWDTSNVIKMESTFYTCGSLTSVPLFDTSNVRSMREMFWGCSKLKTVPAFDTSKVTSMSKMFAICGNLQELPLLDCSSCYNFEDMFYETNIKKVAGFHNLGKQATLSLYRSFDKLNLDRQSVLNVFEHLYDRASAGLSIIRVPLHTATITNAALTDEEIAIATTKGWTVS